jgi:Arc/MetJ-type ribon-helix-helix transcriptional regulator
VTASPCRTALAKTRPMLVSICIPERYRNPVTTQIAVRLPEELVEFIDRLVSDGRAASRAAVVSQALQRERRRELAARDAAILAAPQGTDDDLDALAQHAARIPLDDLD